MAFNTKYDESKRPDCRKFGKKLQGRTNWDIKLPLNNTLKKKTHIGLDNIREYFSFRIILVSNDFDGPPWANLNKL